MRPRDPFQYYLIDYSSGGNFFEDINGVIQTTNVPTPLKHAPGGWMDTELKFSRSKSYYGINRTYSIPLKFVADGAAIIRSVFYTRRGIEQSIQLVVLRWQPDDEIVDGVTRPGDAYYLYYKGLLDLSKMKDDVQEGVEVNIMEGGVVQLLKAYENTVFEIPCDGSIPENVKVNVDGMLFNDVFHYTFLGITSSFPGVAVIPAVFQSNDGDNIGIIHNDPNYEQPTGAGLSYFSSSQNFLFSSIFGTTVRLTGSIIVEADWRQASTLYLYTTTSFSNPRGVGGVDHAVGLVRNQQPAATSFFQPLPSQVKVTGQMVFNFDITQTLGAGEKLFLLFFNEFAGFPIKIIGGNFDISFSSRFQPSRVWGITAWDLFQLLVKSINGLASNFLQTFNYGAQSNLLQEKLNLVVTSGDALRASTDPNYFQYYNLKTLNVANPNNQQFNQFQSLGPVIKTSLKEFFEAFNPILSGALSNQKLPGQPESLFFERKNYVYDSSVVTMTLGEVADLEVEPYLESFFNWLKIGYENPALDEKQGKFEWNTALQMQAPVKTLAKTLEIVSKYHTSPYLTEYTRFNATGGKSTTNNNNDNSVFILNTDFSTFVLDFYSANFLSHNLNTSDPANQNYKLLPNVNAQGMFCPTLDGEYFVADNQPTIFVWNQPITAAPFTLNVSFQAILNGLLTDSCTVKMWLNGVVIRTWTQAVTGVNTPFNITEPAFLQNFSQDDAVWFTVDTSPTESGSITAFQLAVSDGSGSYFDAQMSGILAINQGSTEMLIPLANVAPVRQVSHIDGINHPVVSYGFQYFRFIDILTNSDFTTQMAVSVLTQNNPGQSTTFKLYINGQSQAQFSFNASALQTAQNNSATTPSRTYNLYDIVWVLADCANTNTWITALTIKFNSNIKAYNLLRAPYTNISGILNPQTAYNIEDLTPARMVRAWGSYLRSILFNLIPSQMTFQTLDKNQFLSTVLNGVTITENANINISDLDAPLFTSLVFKFKTQVPVNFADLLNSAANGHIQFSYLGNTFFGFPIEVAQKPSLNDTQEWTLLASPLNNLSLLQNLNFDGLNPGLLNIMPNQIFISHICPLKFVPNGITRNPQYNFIHMDDDWYINQVQFWIFKENYFQKYQLNDTIPIQILTNGIGSANVLIYDCRARLIATVPMTVIAGPLQPPYIQLEATINPTLLGLGMQAYYVVIQAGSATPVISEGIQFATKWPVSLLFQYSNSENKQAAVFSTGYKGAFRAEGWISDFSAETKYTTYEDQPMDITLLNAIPYRKFKLNISAPKGVPDWVWEKAKRILALDTVTIDGHAYTLDDNAKAEVKNTEAWPKRYWSIAIREAANSEGVTFDATGIVENPLVTATIDLNAFGENPPVGGPNLIQVTQE